MAAAEFTPAGVQAACRVPEEEAQLLHLDHAAVDALLPWGALTEALGDMFRQGCEAPLRHAHAWQEAQASNTLLLMPAWQAGRYTGVKIVHVAPGHAPAVHAAYLLSDAASGAPLALLDGGALTDRRTAAASVLAARYLARPESRRLKLLGSGKVAHALAQAYRAAFPIEDIAVWSREPSNAERLAARLRGEGHPARAVPEPDPGEADIVSAATLSRSPLILGDAVQPGTHVDLVGAFRADMRESDAALLKRATLVVDTRAGALAEAGDVVQALAEGAFGPEHVAAELTELCRGAHPGRREPKEVTVFKSVGWAGEDLAAAILAYEGSLAEAGRE